MLTVLRGFGDHWIDLEKGPESTADTNQVQSKLEKLGIAAIGVVLCEMIARRVFN